MSVPLFTFYLPTLDNAGQDLDAAHVRFKEALLSLAGAYTVGLPVDGAWKDGAGKTVTDELVPYLVGCPLHVARAIMTAAHDLFPDQTAIFVTHTGSYGLSVLRSGDDVLKLFESETPAKPAYAIDVQAPTAFDPVDYPDGRSEFAPGDVVGPYAPIPRRMHTL